MEKILLKKGIYTIMACRESDHTIASSNQRFTKGVILSRELSSEMAFSALSISIKTNTDRLRVDAFTLPYMK